MIFVTEEILEVAIESWPEWGLNIPLLNCVQTFKPTELSCHQICAATPISPLCSVFTFHLVFCLCQSPHVL